MYDAKIILDNFIMSLHCHWIDLAGSNLINAKGSKEGTWISRHFCLCVSCCNLCSVDLFIIKKLNKEIKRKYFINLKKGNKFRRKYNMKKGKREKGNRI